MYGMVKTFKVVYYKHIVVINHTRCDTAHLEMLVNIGDVRNLEINTQKININMFTCESFDFVRHH